MTQKAKKEPEQSKVGDLKAKGRSTMNPKCQKCLEQGHWTYQCKGKRKVVNRLTRAAMLRKKMKAQEAASQGRLWELLREHALRNRRRRNRAAHSSSDSVSSCAMSDSASTCISISSGSSSTSSSSRESSCDSSSSSYKDYSGSEPEGEMECEKK